MHERCTSGDTAHMADAPMSNKGPLPRPREARAVEWVLGNGCAAPGQQSSPSEQAESAADSHLRKQPHCTNER